jgi:hypothetical protein
LNCGLGISVDRSSEITQGISLASSSIYVAVRYVTCPPWSFMARNIDFTKILGATSLTIQESNFYACLSFHISHQSFLSRKNKYLRNIQSYLIARLSSVELSACQSLCDRYPFTSWNLFSR